MLLLPLTPSLIYLKLKRFKGPKTHSLFFNKLFYRENPLEKATYTGHELHKKKTSYFTGKFLWKRRRTLDTNCTINLEESYLVPRYRRLTWRSRTSYLAIDD